ncbi:MAG: cytochrome c biogenesis CcdA family protein [bacterium]
MEAILNNISHIIETNHWLAFLAVFFGGMLTASNPCVLAMIPLIIGYVGGSKDVKGFKKSLLFSIVFVIGLSITFTILGVIAVFLGRLFGDVGGFWKYIVFAVCIIMGLYLLGVFKFNIKMPSSWKPKIIGMLGAFLFGLLFGVVSSPCATPILFVLLTLIAMKGNIIYGVALLFFYALGHSVLILVAGTSIGAAKSLLESKGLKKSTGILVKFSGVLIILVGVYFLFFAKL